MAAETHWLLPINPAAHGQHMPADWRTREDATAVWEAIGRSREEFKQVPMSVSRAGEGAVGALRAVSRRTT